MALILSTDGTQAELSPLTIDSAMRVVGGVLEVIEVSNDKYLLVHEEGKLIGLPLNLQASAMLPDDCIVGPAVLCSASELGLDAEDRGSALVGHGSIRILTL